MTKLQDSPPMPSSENKSKKPSSFYSQFGRVDVLQRPHSDPTTVQVSIADNFSSKQVDIEMSRMADGDPAEVGFTLDAVFFNFRGPCCNFSTGVYAYVHKEEALFAIESGSARKWEWTRLSAPDVKLTVRGLPSNLNSQWTHWEEWNRPILKLQSANKTPSMPNSTSQHFLLACTQFSAFVVVPQGGSASVLECIDLPPSKRASFTLPIPAGVVKLCAGNDHLLLLDAKGTVWTVGSGNHGELGQYTLESKWSEVVPVEALRSMGLVVVDIVAGGWHCVALTAEGDVYGWGWNRMGQLGYSAEEIWFTIQPTPYPFNTDKAVMTVDARNEWTAIALEDGSQQIFGAGWTS